MLQKARHEKVSPARIASTIRKQDAQLITFPREELAGLFEQLKTGISNKQLDRLSEKAMKLFINEQFGAKESENSPEDRITVLFQKEILLENILALLASDNVDVNALLFSAFEKAQCEHYAPPTDESIVSSGSFRFPDAMKLPTPRWKKSSQLVKELKLELKDLGNNCGSNQISLDKKKREKERV